MIITRIKLDRGMGDAINARVFLLCYCEQRGIPQNTITIYTDRHKVFFEGDKFILKDLREDTNRYPLFSNVGNINTPMRYRLRKPDLSIAHNFGIKYNWDMKRDFNWVRPNIDHVKLPEKFITINYGFDNISKDDEICAKVWLVEYWEQFVKKIGVPVVQIGAGKNCKHIKGVDVDLVDKLNIKESAEVLRKAMFHVDTEGGLVILNQQIGGKSVVLFGATPMDVYAREGNLNIVKNRCKFSPCELNSSVKSKIYMKKDNVYCDLRCMKDLDPDFVVEQIYKNHWL